MILSNLAAFFYQQCPLNFVNGKHFLVIFLGGPKLVQRVQAKYLEKSAFFLIFWVFSTFLLNFETNHIYFFGHI